MVCMKRGKYDKNSSGDEIANVNFFYDDTLQTSEHNLYCV